jgi:tRNA/tmRNA/rRNA uracil-C5-methylase (TrmA/RlmC/RlmD family)
VPYEVEREIKKNQVGQLMQRIGHLKDVPVSLMPIPEDLAQNQGYHYRNRATVHRQKRECGFFKHDNHQVFSVEECPISAPALEEMIREEAKQPEGLPRVDLRVDSDGNPVSQAQAWFMVNVQQHSYKIPLDSFFQTHYEGAAQIIRAIQSWISDLPGRDLLIDAYGGVGLFSAALANAYSKTVLIELDKAAVETARENMRNNQPEARFEAHASPVETTLSGLLRAHDPRRTHVILDPPRIGLQPQIIDILLARTPQFVFYISCDPSKMARDLSRLSAHYRVHSIQLIDMFPRTAHIESIAFLECSKEEP